MIATNAATSHYADESESAPQGGDPLGVGGDPLGVGGDPLGVTGRNLTTGEEKALVVQEDEVQHKQQLRIMTVVILSVILATETGSFSSCKSLCKSSCCKLFILVTSVLVYINIHVSIINLFLTGTSW